MPTSSRKDVGRVLVVRKSGHQCFRKRRIQKKQKKWKEVHSFQRKWRNRWLDSSHWYFCQSVSVSTEQSQTCAKTWIQSQEIKPKVTFVNLWWYRLRFPVLTPYLRVQHQWHMGTCCKNTNGNSQKFLMIRNCRNWAPTQVSYRKLGMDTSSRFENTHNLEISKHPDREGGFVRIR